MASLEGRLNEIFGMKSSKTGLFIAVFLVFSPVILHAGSLGLSVFDLEISPKQNSDGVMHVKLTSRNQKPVTIDRADLPWSSVITLRIQIFRLDDRNVELERFIPMVYQARRKFLVTLQPNETIEGDVNLSNEFPELESEIKQHGVIVAWKCEVALLNVRCPSEEGMFEIPRKASAPGGTAR